MAQQLIDRGLAPGDGNGEDGYSAFGKVNDNFTQLFAFTGGGGNGYFATTISAATTNDFTTGGIFPTGAGRIDFTAATVNFALTGLVAGTDAQPLIIRNLTTKTMTLNYENAGSLVANRFTGAGTGSAYPPGFVARLTYYTNPSPRWSIG